MPSPPDARLRETDALLREVEAVAAGPPAPQPAPRPEGYLATTRTATYGFVAALPLLLLYEVGVLLANAGFPGQIRVGADVWLKNLLGLTGLAGWALIAAATALVGAAVFWTARPRRPPLVGRYFGGIVAESLAYAVGLALLVGGTVGLLFGAWPWPGGASGGAARPLLALGQLASLPLGLQLALSIGAGLYEELVFRVLLVGGLALGLRRVVADRRVAYAVAAVVGALVFSAVHYTGAFGDAFLLSSFTFRFLFGLALNAVFLVRGFALAAWTHALYDVLVVTGGL